MNLYRCTRNLPYEPGTPGHTDASARQGYYIEAHNESEAHVKMAQKFNTEADIFAGFTVTLWRSHIRQGEGPITITRSDV
jgi:hypothetical protein